MDTPVLLELDVNGVLEFLPNVNATIKAQYIFVRTGSIVSGSQSSPTPANVTHVIELHGNPLDDSFAFSATVQGGNKVIVVTGNLSLYGYPKASASYLELNSYPGDKFIFVTGVDWDFGDNITIAPSGFLANETEEFTIVGIVGKGPTFDDIQASRTVASYDFSNDNDWITRSSLRQYGRDVNYKDSNQIVLTASSTGITKLLLNKPISFYHSGAPISINNYIADLRTEVGLTSRNVKIKTEGNGWGYSIVVNDFLDTNVNGNPVLRPGFVNIDNVGFHDCAQFDNDLACLRFDTVYTKNSSVTNSVFTNTSSWAVYFNSANNINFTNNVLSNLRWRGIVALNITNVTLNYNSIYRISQRNYNNSILDASAGFHVCSYLSPICSYTLIGNKVFGFDFIAYLISGGECYKGTKVVANNKARSGNVGYLITNNGQFNCIQLSGLKAHFCQEGLGFRSSAFLVNLSNFEFIENLIGMTMNVGRANDHSIVSANLSNSVFIGKTINSNCQNCAIDSDCKQRIGYMFGLCNLQAPDIHLTSKVVIPLSGQKHEANMLGQENINSLLFMNFNDNLQCTKMNVPIIDFAISSNDNSPDYQLPQFSSNITFYNIGSQNKIFMNIPDPAWVNPEDCYNWNCTGPLNSVLFDLDGSVVGSNGGYVLPNNPGVAKNDICTLSNKMNSYICQKKPSDVDVYYMLEIESYDSDNTTRTFSPINVTTYVVPSNTAFYSALGGKSGYRNDLANFQDHTWDGFYTGHIRWNRFPTLVYSGQYYNITTTGTVPTNMEFRLQATQGFDRPVVITMHYQNPGIVQLYINNVLVPGIDWINGTIAECNLNNSHGTNRWFQEQRLIQFVLRNEIPVMLIQQSSVQLNMEIDISIADFFSKNGQIAFIDKFAALLGIPSYRIRIVNVRKGSTILTIELVADVNQSPADQYKYITNLETQVTSLVSSGTLQASLNITLLNYTSTVVYQTQAGSSSGSSNQGSSGSGGQNSGQNSGSGSSDGSGPGNSPSGSNQGGTKPNKIAFEVIAADWVVAIFAGIIFILIVISGLVLYQKKVNKTISLKEILPGSSISPENSSVIKNLNNSGWIPDVEDQEIGEPRGVVRRLSFAEEFSEEMK